LHPIKWATKNPHQLARLGGFHGNAFCIKLGVKLALAALIMRPQAEAQIGAIEC
jgi:hypothetical protein